MKVAPETSMLSARVKLRLKARSPTPVQPCGLFFRLLRRAFHHQTGAFQLNIQIFLTETGQRKGNAVVVIVAFSML